MPNWLRTNKFPILAAVLTGIAIPAILSFAMSNPRFMFAIPIGFVLLLVLTINFHWLILLVLFSRALLDPVLDATKISFLGESIGIGGVLNALVIGLALVLIVIRAKQWRSGFPVFMWWIAFLAVSFVAVLYSPGLGSAFKLYLNLFSCFMVFSTGYLVAGEDNDKRHWIRVLFVSSFLPVILAHVGVLSGGRWFYHQTTDAGARLEGTFTHPNILAFYLVFVLILVFYMLRSPLFKLSKTKRFWLYVYMVDLLLVLLFTKTRSAWIGCWMIFLIYGIFKEKKFFWITLLAPFLLVMVPQVRERAVDLMQGTGSNQGEQLNSFAWRVKLWQASLGTIKESLWRGHGLASFQEMSHQFFTSSRKGVAAHNTFVEILFETGILGLVSYIMIFAKLMKRFFKPNVLLFAYVLSYAMVSFSDNMLYYLAFNWYFWFFIGLSARSVNAVEKA